MGRPVWAVNERSSRSRTAERWLADSVRGSRWRRETAPRRGATGRNPSEDLHCRWIWCDGRFLLPLLAGEGHEVVALTRSPQRAAALERRGVKSVVGDV